jgi:5'-3' exonuclease
LGFVVWPAARWSADDVLASAATTYAASEDVTRIFICSADLDFLQCVRGKRVVAMNRSRRSVTDEAAVRARFGVAPSALPDLFALCGDRSDGVAGVPGWGHQTAGKVLGRWDSIDAIPDDHAQWDVAVRGAAQAALALRRHREEAMFARDLLRLNDGLPIRTTVDQLRWQGADAERLSAVYDRLGIATGPALPAPF